MRETQWILDTPGGQYSLSLQPASRSLLRTTHDTGARRALEAWLLAARASGRARWLMGEVGRVLARPLGRETPTAEVLLRTAYAEGRLRLERLPNRVPHGRDEKLETFAHDGAGVRDELTWIAIRLEYDDDSGQGVAYARYVLKLPDGEVREGQLDRDGNARLDGLHPGMCEVTFPEHDSRKGAPPAKVPPGKGHQPRRRSPRANESVVNARGGSNRAVRCHAKDIEFLDVQGRVMKRQPGPGRLLQVVPLPTKRDVVEQGVPVNSVGAEKLSKAADGFSKVLDQWKASPSWSDFVKSLGAMDKRPEPGMKWGLSLKSIGDRYYDGVRSMRARVAREPDCGEAHPVEFDTGAATIAFRLGDEPVDLKGASASAMDHDAQPVVYPVRAVGCEGDAQDVRIEVFPSDQYLLAKTLEAKASPLGNWSRVLDFLDQHLALTLDFDCIMEGRVEGFWGWREDPADWKVYHSSEFRMRLAPRFEAKLQASLVSMAWHVPRTFRKYVGDIGVMVGVELGVLASGEYAKRRYPAAPAESRSTEKGTLQLVGKCSVGLYAQAGSKEILGASVTGTLNSDFKGSAGLSFKDGAVMASPTLELGEGRWQIKVLTRALVWKYEASWDAVAWEKRTYPEKPFDVSILDVRSLATTVL